MHYDTFLAFGVYFFILLIIGLSAHRRSRTEADYIMGGRSLNFWLTALSAQAADMSAWLFMGFAALIYMKGLSALWLAIGLVVGNYLNWTIVAPGLRRGTEKLDSYTLPSFFAKRFNDRGGILRSLTAALTLLFMTHYMSAGLNAVGTILKTVFGIDFEIGIGIATAVMLTYVFVGGYVTIAWTDCFQAVLLLVVAMIVPLVAYFNLEPGAVQSAAAARDVSFSLVPDFSVPTLFSAFALSVGWGVGYFGMPHVVTKFMGIDDPSNLKKSKYVGVSWQILALTGAAMVGLVGIGYFPDGLADPQLVFVNMVWSVFVPLIAGFILCGLLAANLSTLDSQMLVCATVLSEDVYRMVKKQKPTSKQLLYTSRGGVILMSLLAFTIASTSSASIQETVEYSWAGLGCTFGPLMLMALFSKSANFYGALAGIIVGGTIAIFWPHFQTYVPEYVMPSTVPGFFLSLLTIYAVSKTTAPHFRL